MLPLSRRRAVERLRPQLWRYLYESATLREATEALGAIFQLRASDLQRLLTAHLVLSHEAQRARDAIDGLLPRLPATATLDKREVRDRVDGRVDWTATSRRRAGTWDPSVFVCDTPIRRYDTKQSRAVRQAVEELKDACRQTGLLDKGETGRKVWESLRWCESVLRNPKVSSASHKRLTPGELRALAGSESLRPITDFLDLRRRLLSGADASQILEVLSARVLAPLDRPTLLELLVVFQLAEEYERKGYVRQPVDRLLGAASPAASLVRGADRVDLYWRTDYWTVLKTAHRGVLDESLAGSGLPSRVLRPDVIVKRSGAGREELIVGEVKYTDVDPSAAEGRGLRDALAYLHDVQGSATGRDMVRRGFVVAWGSLGRVGSTEVVVCGMGQIPRLVERLDAAPQQSGLR